MSISTIEGEDRTSKFSAVLKGTVPGGSEPSPRKRWLPRWLIVSSVLVAVLGLVAATVKSTLLPSSGTGRAILTEKVHRADLIVSVTEDGNVESAHNKDIKCEVQGGSTILWLIKDGTEVKQGDELVRLDSAPIEDKISMQRITFEKAKAAMIDAEKLFNSAEIAVEEYKEGTYKQSQQDLQAKSKVAKENLESAKNLLAFYNKMARSGYVTPLQRDAQAFAVERAQLDLGVADTALQVLEKFTLKKTLVGLESTRDSAEARMASEKAAFNLEKDRLERLETQLLKCTIIAPDEGMVVYANEEAGRRGGGGSPQQMVEEGATMRERQSILRLPDLSHMQVKCTVHESRVDSIEPGMRARIRIQDHEYQGVVTAVANQAEPSNFFSGSVKEYGTTVSIDSDPHGLRPGMTAAVEILIANLSNIVSVQVQSVVEIGGKFFCWVNGPTGPQKRPVVLGMSNNTRIEIKDGLAEGDEVLLNPRAVVEEARQEVHGEAQVDVKKKFGGDKKAVLPKSDNRPAAGGKGAAAASGKAAAGKSGKAAAGKSGKGGGRAGFDLMALDKDGDKKISKDEAPDQMKSRFEEIDTNKDGFIDQAEGNAMMQKVRQRMQQQGGAQGGGGDVAPATRGGQGAG